MHTPINGWNKAKILAVIAARRDDTRSVGRAGFCLYENDKGNRCAVGLFMPDKHDALLFQGDAADLIKAFPELADTMPLDVDGMLAMQAVHDDTNDEGSSVKARLTAWVNKHVEE